MVFIGLINWVDEVSEIMGVLFLVVVLIIVSVFGVVDELMIMFMFDLFISLCVLVIVCVVFDVLLSMIMLIFLLLILCGYSVVVFFFGCFSEVCGFVVDIVILMWMFVSVVEDSKVKLISMLVCCCIVGFFLWFGKECSGFVVVW